MDNKETWDGKVSREVKFPYSSDLFCNELLYVQGMILLEANLLFRFWVYLIKKQINEDLRLQEM